MKQTKRASFLVTLVLALLPSMLAAQTVEFIGAKLDGVDGVDGLAGPRYVAVSPDGSNVYVASEGDNAITVFARNHSTGDLGFVQAVFDEVDGVDGLGGADAIQISADGRHVYVGGAFDRAITVFKRRPSTGELEFVESHFDEENGVIGLASPVWMTLSDDGRDLYVSGFFASSIVHFRRNEQSGRLRYLHTYTDGEEGILNMTRPFGTRISPDGRHFYVAALGSAAITVFNRRPATGQLTYASSVVEGVDGVEGLAGVRDIQLNPSGRHLYSASLQGASVDIFSRRKRDGALTFRERLDGVPGAPSVIMNGQRRVYTLSFAASALLILGRDTVTGELSLGDLEFDAEDGVFGMRGPLHLAVSPNGKHLYVPGFTGNGIAIFETSR